MPRLKLLAVASALVALLVVPAAAHATLAFVRSPIHSTVFVANDDGSGAKKLGAGFDPRVSPDGETVIYLHEGAGHAQQMKLYSVLSGRTRTVMSGWQDTLYSAYSPDSSEVAAMRGPELGKRKLVVIDLATGAQRVLARGYFSGVSFSPDGGEIVYSRAAHEKYPPRSDVYRVPVAGGRPVALTGDHDSESPLWGPNGEIVFVKLLEAKKRMYGPKNELFLMNAQGKGVRRLTHTKVDPLLQGLIPAAWSADGSRLLAEFGGQDTSYAVTVNPKTGAQRPLLKAEGAGFVGTGLSQDGSAVLGYVGGFEPGPRHDVVTVPYGGGRPKILVRNAYEPSWSR
jgi:Tol biopolymer transport system component